MSTEKRTVVLVLACVLWIVSANFVLGRLGLLPKPAVKEAPVAQPEDPVAEVEAETVAVQPELPLDVFAKEPTKLAPLPGSIVVLKPDELVLGSVDAGSGYNLNVQLTQRGAGVETVVLSRHEAERVYGQKARRPLRLIDSNPDFPPSYSIDLVSDSAAPDPRQSGLVLGLLGDQIWEVVRDEKGAAIRSDRDASDQEIGQSIVFRAKVGSPALTVTKTFTLLKNVDGLALKLAFESPTERTIEYRLYGPNGLPIEGDWYTSVFREVFFGQENGKSVQVETRLANDIVKKKSDPEQFMTLPIQYAGVENQYFASFFAPESTSPRIDAITRAEVITEAKEAQKSDVSVSMTSIPLVVGPGHKVEQGFKIFAGPKIADTLKGFGATDLASYRKSSWFSIPYASTIAQGVIAPLLDRIYSLTANVSRMFGGQRGSYGIAIILLTITVRLILFPLSRKQAVMAKRMQDLQPQMTELREKYKDDKEAMTRETFALYKRYKVNPLGGCLPALIQMPIFVGLWQALNNSVSLRHAPFLWIDNLAAPDMLFQFPGEVPFLGRYFNLLPLAVVGLMLVQTKLFSPPATSPDQEATQKMMKYMMVFMGFMFYKVPSGLGIYFITSSSWAICERLLLPKMIKSKPVPLADEIIDVGPSLRSKSGIDLTSEKSSGSKGWRDRLLDRLEQLREEASNDRTVRNNGKDTKNDDWGRGSNGGNGGGSSPRRKPPGKKR